AVAVGIAVVQRKVLERRDHLLALDSVHRFGAEAGADEWILGVVLVVATVAGVSREVDPGGEHDVESPDSGLAGDRLAAFPWEPRIERGADENRRRHGRSIVARPIA